MSVSLLMSVCMVMRVAITGGIACGKSLFSHTLRRLGMELLDADDVVHSLEAPGGAAVPELVRLFGASVLDRAGGIDRAALAERVFADAEARRRLNAAIHPRVRQILAGWAGAGGQPGGAGALRGAVIPLLFEAGWVEDWDFIICLVSDETLQLERLMRFRGLTKEQARKRIAAQMPVAEKAARSHLAVHNDADAEALAKEAEKVYRLLTEKADEYRKRVP
jgi:dephospho-CoA kinase